MKRLFITLMVLLISFSGYADNNQKFDVYLLIGQSNCAGRGPMLAIDSTEIQDGVWLLNDQGVPEPARGPMNRYSNIRKDLSMQMVGPAMSFGRLMHHYTSRPILLVQNARGGSGMKSWMPDSHAAYLDSTLIRARQALKYGKLKGIVWHQGETDIDHQSAGAIYVSRFRMMVETLRKELANGEEVPILVGEVPQWNWPGKGAFEKGDDASGIQPGRRAIDRFNDSTLVALTQEIPNCHKVYSTDLKRRGKESDPHFSRDANLLLGQRFAEVMTPLVSQIYVTTYLNDRASAISFTYDDGYLEHLTLVAPELEKRGFRGTFWIIGNKVGTTDKYGPRVSWQQVSELLERGHEAASHTWSHPHLTRMHDLDSVRQEMVANDTAFQNHGLPKPLTMAYPYNGFKPDVRTICEDGRIGSRTRQVGHGEQNNKSTPEKLSRWLQQVINERDWGITMTHGITHGYDMWYHPEWLWNFYDEVKAHEDSVWVGTFAEVAAYQKERAHLLLNVKTRSSLRKGRIKFTITPTISDLDPNIFHEWLTLRIDGDFTDKKIVAKQGRKTLTVTNHGTYILINFDPFGERIITKVSSSRF